MNQPIIGSRYKHRTNGDVLEYIGKIGETYYLRRTRDMSLMCGYLGWFQLPFVQLVFVGGNGVKCKCCGGEK